MQFLTPNETEVELLLNDNNLQYKDDIDIKIVDGPDVVGFIISTSSPVRFVGVGDFGCHGNAFDEYRLFLDQPILEFAYENDIQTIPNISTSEDSSGTRPYIENTNNFSMFPDSTIDITLNGGIYDPSIELDFGPAITVNHFTLIEPQKIIANITSSSDMQDPYEIVMSRGGLYHFGEKPTMEVSDKVYGTGLAGTFLIDFNGGGTGNTAWGSDWDLSVTGTIDSIDGLFKTSSGTTPSGTTGPNAPYDSFYMFTERSSNNNGIGQDAFATTSNFHQLVQLEFRLHMYGSGIGKLIVESQDLFDDWTERWIQDGSLQSSQDDPFLLITLDASGWDCKAIRFIFKDTTSYSADVALDNITLTSI